MPVKKDSNNALLNAARDRNFEKIKDAIEQGADVNAKTETGRTTLITVSDHEASYEIIEYLMNDYKES